jgi:hypothetical protein
MKGGALSVGLAKAKEMFVLKLTVMIVLLLLFFYLK